MGLEGLLDEDFHDGRGRTLWGAWEMSFLCLLVSVSKLVQTLHSQGRGPSPMKGGFSQTGTKH